MRIPVPSPQELETSERQQAWRQRSIARLIEERSERRKRLDRDEVTEALRRALASYGGLATPDVDVRIRTPFVALQDPRPLPAALGGTGEDELDATERRREDWRTRPPLTKLIMGRTRALATYLALLYATEADADAVRPGRPNVRANVLRREGRDSWSVLCGRWASTARARRARLTRDLDELARADLVEIGGSGLQGRYEGFGLLSEVGSGEAYRAPKLDLAWPAILALPSAFFRRGWHLILTPAEIASLLVARHALLLLSKSSDEPGVAIPRSTRWSRYGLSGEAYGSIHELEEFGLLKVYDTMPQRRHGKFEQQDADVRAEQEAEGHDLAPVPYRLEPADDGAFDRSAIETVRECLQQSPAPPRLSEWDGIVPR